MNTWTQLIKPKQNILCKPPSPDRFCVLIPQPTRSPVWQRLPAPKGWPRGLPNNRGIERGGAELYFILDQNGGKLGTFFHTDPVHSHCTLNMDSIFDSAYRIHDNRGIEIPYIWREGCTWKYTVNNTVFVLNFFMLFKVFPAPSSHRSVVSRIEGSTPQDWEVCKLCFLTDPEQLRKMHPFWTNLII